MGNKKDDKVDTTIDTGIPIVICACGSTDWIQQPSGGIICRHCGRPVVQSSPKKERP